MLPRHEPLAVLAAAAAVTSRITLTTNILVAPLTTAAVLAKEAATVSSLAGGRFLLGLGPGVRADDFEAAQRDFGPGARPSTGSWRSWHGCGSTTTRAASRPRTAFAHRRAQRRRGTAHRALGGGLDRAGADTDRIAPAAEQVREAWAAAGREGRPRLVALSRFWLGEEVAREAAGFVREYFGVLGDEADAFVAKTPRTPEQVREQVTALAAAGFDEVVFHPTAAHLSQVDRLADVLIP
ncbi:LLM class flavin-dependent oxidoreductase [Streptomyces sp. INA 01156]